MCNGELAVILGSALRLLSEKLTPERLLWMTGFMLYCNCDCRSGAPSLLGRGGGLLFWRTCKGAIRGFAGDEISGEVMIGCAGACDGLEGDSCSSGRFFLNFCDDFRGGGLGGNGESLPFFFYSFFFPSLLYPFTVETEGDEVSDSRRGVRPCGSAMGASVSFALLPDRPRIVTGGLLTAGLPCRTLEGVFRGAMMPGDMDDMDVGVVSLL